RHYEALVGCERGDVARRYRTVELSAFGRLAQHREALAVKLLCDLFGLALELKVARLEFDFHCLEAGAVFLGGAQRLAAGQEVVPREAVLDAHDFAHLAELGHTFEQDHFHGSLRGCSGRSGPWVGRGTPGSDPGADVEGGIGEA